MRARVRLKISRWSALPHGASGSRTQPGRKTLRPSRCRGTACGGRGERRMGGHRRTAGKGRGSARESVCLLPSRTRRGELSPPPAPSLGEVSPPYSPHRSVPPSTLTRDRAPAEVIPGKGAAAGCPAKDLRYRRQGLVVVRFYGTYRLP